MNRRGLLFYLPAVLLIAHFLIVFSCISKKSVTDDERIYVMAGYYQWKTGDSLLNFFQPPFVKLWSTWPLLFLNPDLPMEGIDRYLKALDTPKTSVSREWHLAQKFFYQSNKNADRLIFWARVPVVFLSLLAALLVYIWSLDLYGSRAAVFSLTLFVLNPMILAYGQYVMMDPGLILFFLATLYCLYKYLKTAKKAYWIAAVCMFGLALLTKFNASFLFVITAILLPFAIRKREISTRHAAALLISFILGGWLIVGLGYKFEKMFGPKPEFLYSQQILDKPSLAKGPLSALFRVASFALPGDYFKGVDYQLAQSQKRTSYDWDVPYLHGRYKTGGWRSYFLIGLLIRTPIPLLIFICASLVLFVARREENKPFEAEFLLIPACFILFYFSFFNKLQSGIRYIAPVIPFGCILCGKLLSEMQNRKRLLKITGSVLIAWYVLTPVKIYPSYLTYFNELIGGPRNGHKWMLAGDWGQSLKRLAAYIRSVGNPEVRLSYFGGGDPFHYHIPHKPFLKFTGNAPPDYSGTFVPDDGWLAVSSSRRQGVFEKNRRTFWWLDGIRPHKHIGSILVYRLKPSQTEAIFRKLIRENPDFTEAHLSFGRWLIKKKRYSEAGEALENSMRTDPVFVPSIRELEKLCRFSGLPKRSSVLKRRLELLDRAGKYFKEGRYDLSLQALGDVQKSLKAPSHRLLLRMGLAYMRLNDLQKAEDCLRRSIAVNPRYPQTYYNMSLVQLEKKDLPKAKEYLQKSLRLNPDYRPARLLLLKLFPPEKRFK